MTFTRAFQELGMGWTELLALGGIKGSAMGAALEGDFERCRYSLMHRDGVMGSGHFGAPVAHVSDCHASTTRRWGYCAQQAMRSGYRICCNAT